MPLDWEVPCWVKGCGGKWRSEFMGILQIPGNPLRVHEIRCTEGGDEHVKRFLQLREVEEEKGCSHDVF